MSKTITTFKKQKAEGDKITMVTCYDYSMAKLMDQADVDILLVGDSLGMVMMGLPDTLGVTMDDMVHHTLCVSRGAENAFVLGDMPFLSYTTP